MLRRVIFLLILTAICDRIGVTALAEPVSEQAAGQRTLDDWREVLRTLDPADAAAAKHAPGLTLLIQDAEIPWLTRRQAALALGRMGRPAVNAVPVLIKLLSQDEPDRETTRLWAAKALALFGPLANSAAPNLAEISLDGQESFPLRATALEALGRIGADSPHTLPTLIAVLSAHDLGLSPEERQTQLSIRISAAEGLGLLGPAATPAIPSLLEALRDDSALLRLAAATTLGTLGPAAEISLPGLVDALLFDDAPEVADAAARSLGRIGPAALPALERFIEDADVEVRLRATWGLAEAGRGGLTLLNTALDDHDPKVAVSAANILIATGHDGSPSAVLKLIELLGAEERQVRMQAYSGLRQVPGRLSPHRKILEQAATSNRAEVALAAKKLLAQLDQLEALKSQP